MARRKHTGRPREVFLSHSSRNRKFVNKLASVLRHHGVPVWYSEKHIVGAQQWYREINNGCRDLFKIWSIKYAPKE